MVPRVTLDAQEPPPRVVKVTSLIMHSPLLFIHFYHLLSSFLAPHTFFFHSTLFSHCPSIPFVAFHWTFYLPHQIPLLSSPTGPPLFFPCVQTTSTISALLDQPTLITLVPLCTSFYLTWSISITPHTLLKHLISIIFNIFYSTAIFHVSVPYSAVDTATSQITSSVSSLIHFISTLPYTLLTTLNTYTSKTSTHTYCLYLWRR